MAEVTEDRPRVQMRRECLASSAINSNRLEDCESTVHFPDTSRGEEQMRCHATAVLTRYTLRNPRNWATINDRQRLYRCIPLYILPRPHTHKSLLCDPRNSHVSILTPPHFRRPTSGKISSLYRRDRRLLRKRLSRNRIVRLSTLSPFVSFTFRPARSPSSYQSGIKSTRF